MLEKTLEFYVLNSTKLTILIITDEGAPISLALARE